MKRYLYAIALVAILGVAEAAAQTVPVTGIALYELQVLHKVVGEAPVTLPVFVLPLTATNRNINWATSNAAVATVTNGVVNFTGAGTATITATTEEGNYTATCSVTVYATIPELSFTGNRATISSEGTYTIPKSVWDDPALQNEFGHSVLYLDIVNSLEPIIGFEGALVNVMWGPEVGSVRTSVDIRNQYIQVDIPGFWGCVWTLESNQGKTARLYVRRVADPTLTIGEESKPLSQWDLTSPIDVPGGTSVTLGVDEFFVDKWNRLYLNGSQIDRNQTTYVLTQGGDYELSTGDGLSFNERYSVQFTLNYVSSTVPVISVTLDQTVLAKTVGDEPVTLVATVQPGDATNKEVLWSTSDANVATVTNGVVNFTGAGTATITATTEEGNYTATCSVTVYATIPELSFTGNRATISSEGTYTIPKSVWDDPAFQNFGGQTDLYLDIVNSLEPIIGFEGALVNIAWLPAVGSARTSVDIRNQYIQVDIPGFWGCMWTLESNQGKSAFLYIRRVADPTLTIGEESKPLSQWDLTSPIDVPGGTSVTLGVDEFFVDKGGNHVLWKSGVLHDHSKTSYDLTGLGSGNVVYTVESRDGISSNPTYSLSFTLNYDEPATPQYTITTSSNPSDGGVTSGDGIFDEGIQRTVSVLSSNPGYNFVNWTENGVHVSYAFDYTFTLKANRDLVANFESLNPQFSVSLTAVPSEGGEVTGGGSFASGTQITVAANAHPGFAFLHWSENGVALPVPSVYTFGVSADRSLVAHFEAIVSVSGVTLNHTVLSQTIGDASVALVATVLPEDATNKDVSWSTSDAAVAAVSADGVVSFAGVGTAVITVTTDDGSKTATCSVSVAAAPVPDFTVSLTAVPSEGGEVIGGGTFASGTQITVAANAHSGFVFLHWSENGVALPVPSVYTFGVSANRSLVAHFEATGTTNAPELASTASPLRAWTRIGGGMLHISGATIGEPLSIYSVSGALVYQALPQSAEIDVALPMPAGVYVIHSGGNTARVVVE